MFRIRRVFDDNLDIDRNVITQVQRILGDQFSLLPRQEIEKLPLQLKDPLKFRYRTILFVADDLKGNVKGFATLLYFSDLGFCYLDFISAAKLSAGRGVGGALYERVREEAVALKSRGLFMECLPDDPRLSPDPAVLKQNRARLKFYERYGARPVINTKYETPLSPGDTDPPYLVFDDLGRKVILRRDETRIIVRSIIERKYHDVCSPEYVKMVVDSFRDDPVRIRDFKYIKSENLPLNNIEKVSEYRKIGLVINDLHEIHHVRERGYVEAPARISSILKELKKTDLFSTIKIKHFRESRISTVHNRQLVNYIRNVSGLIKPGQSVYPYVFPIRNRAIPPKELPVRAGYFCIDTFTPINSNAYKAAKRAVDCTLTAADHIRSGGRLAYALVRPPGHHAETDCFGGFCYFNSAAIAADYLSAEGKIAMLDIDYHHGNGQQEIFYKRNDVFTVSIHGNPRFAYPYFAGFESERGEGPGVGFNRNFPLREAITFDHYRETLQEALKLIRRFDPKFLIVCLGLDTAKGDPTGTWDIRAQDFKIIGSLIAEIKRPVLCVQEGGYNTRTLGVNARNFFSGLWESAFKP